MERAAVAYIGFQDYECLFAERLDWVVSFKSRYRECREDLGANLLRRLRDFR